MGSPDVDVLDDKRRRIGEEDMIVAYRCGGFTRPRPQSIRHHTESTANARISNYFNT